MRIGYPCINNTLQSSTNSTFRLNSYSEDKLISTVGKNIDALTKILEFNVKHDFLFLRIGSGFVPFASHPVCQFNWQNHFKNVFRDIGDYIKKNKFRISMHPDQFVLINALNEKIIKASIAELDYHCDLLDLLELDSTAKVQIHVGGVYNDKDSAIQRFIQNYEQLTDKIKKRLVIENDDRLFDAEDCLLINKSIHIPIIFDVFHHECLYKTLDLREALMQCMATWKACDGLPMIDYSSQALDERKGKHTDHIDPKHFQRFLTAAKGLDFDIMLEIKDKEISASDAKKILDKLNLN